MTLDINVVAGLVAGAAAMLPGAIIYSPKVLGNAWMKETGHKMGEGSPGKAVAKMFVTSLANGLMASILVWSAGANNFLDAFRLSFIVVAWFWLSANLMLVFFEGRSLKWFRITALSHICTALVIGVVLGLFAR